MNDSERLIVALNGLKISEIELSNGFRQKRFLGSILNYSELKVIADFIIQREADTKEDSNSDDE